jgi:hypothetical protein
MKLILTMLVVTGTLATAQDKPRVFVAGTGTQNVATNASAGGNRWFRSGHSESTIDAHNESMEITKDLQKECPGVTVTLNQSSADYTLMLDRESKQKRGLLRTNNQIQVANRIGDVIDSHATRTVNNASRDACALILADWAQHGKLAQDPAPVAEKSDKPLVQPVLVPANLVTPGVPTQETAQEEQTRADHNTVVVSTAPPPNESLGDAAKRAKQHQACLKLAADNPSVSCK